MTRNQATAAIPAKLNGVILAAAILTSVLMLWVASHSPHWWVVALAAVAFSFVNNTIFSLLHEAVHGILHPNARVNEWAGRLTACFFPTSFSVQRAFHLTHHRYNRTHYEQFDLIRPGDNRALKIIQWYSILTGVYGFSPTVFCLAYALWPSLFCQRGRRPIRSESGVSYQTSATIYFSATANVPLRIVRWEVLAAAAVQVAIFYGLGLTFSGWLLCHTAFAFNWSALQYADHAFSPLDSHDGAWNLRVARPIRWLFLNYHYHLAHHREPQLPWLYLPSRVTVTSADPSFWSIYLRMWLGPRLLKMEQRRQAQT
jgi:fatty acid desaturase